MTTTVTPSNFAYLEEILDFRPSSNPSRFDQCLDVMKKYSEKGDRWWIENHGDCVSLAARQLDEPVLLIPMEVFIKGITIVLGRIPNKSEISSHNEAFIAEFKEKYQEYLKNN